MICLYYIIGFQNNHVLKLDYMHYIHNSHNLLPHCKIVDEYLLLQSGLENQSYLPSVQFHLYLQ